MANNSRLQQDIRMLGEVLGNVIKQHDGEQAFNAVESMRLLAKDAYRKNHDLKNLMSLISKLDSKQILICARAFAYFLNLTNIAEHHHRLRRMLYHEHNPNYRPQTGSIADLFVKFGDKEIAAEKILENISKLQIDLVLTAHPTEITRRTLMHKYDALECALMKLDSKELTLSENRKQKRLIEKQITAIWYTDVVRQQRPTPLDEVKWGLAVIEANLWQAIPDYLRRFDSELKKYCGKNLPYNIAPIKFSSWMGGDRDGNPFVTAEVTKKACLMARWVAADLYLKEIQSLSADLSLTKCNDVIREKVGDAKEPYRKLLQPIKKKLTNTRSYLAAEINGKKHEIKDFYVDESEILATLEICYQSLCDIKADVIANSELLDNLRRLHCFGLNLTKLDIRQERGVHYRAWQEICKQQLRDYSSLNEAERMDFLLQVIKNPTDMQLDINNFSDETKELFATLEVIKTQPSSCFNSYVISLTTSAADVLEVVALQKIANITSMLPVVPLFESEKDLRNAAHCVEQLLSIDEYLGIIQGEQQVMIGYSDSAKDAGILAASWHQYCAQEQLAKVAAAKNVKLTLFHGRGGSVGRGGAPTHIAILSQPPATINGSIRITQQGEVIRNKFGSLAIAKRTLEIYTTATLEAMLMFDAKPHDKWRQLMEQMATASSIEYRDVTQNNTNFFEYFRSITPADEFAHLTIGSRPAKRKTAAGLESLRAIPWVFAWTQNRMLLPGWLGVEAAINEAIENGNFNDIEAMKNEWLFFDSTLSLVEMVLAKSSISICNIYFSNLVNTNNANIVKLHKELLKKFRITLRTIKTILGRNLLADNKIMRLSIAARSPYILLLNLLQVELLKRLRDGANSNDELIDQGLLVTMVGIAAGMRNTG